MPVEELGFVTQTVTGLPLTVTVYLVTPPALLDEEDEELAIDGEMLAAPTWPAMALTTAASASAKLIWSAVQVMMAALPLTSAGMFTQTVWAGVDEEVPRTSHRAGDYTGCTQVLDRTWSRERRACSARCGGFDRRARSSLAGSEQASSGVQQVTRAGAAVAVGAQLVLAIEQAGDQLERGQVVSWQ